MSLNSALIFFLFIGFAFATSSLDSSLSAASRQLLQVDESLSSSSGINGNYTFLNVSDCIFFYARKIEIQQKNVTITLPSLDYLNSRSSCNNDSTSAELTAVWDSDLPIPLKTVHLKMSFDYANRSSDWILSGVSLTLKSLTNELVELDDVPAEEEDYNMITAPQRFSYHCTFGNNWNFYHEENNATIVTTILIEKLQVQAFDITNDKFGHPNDCVGFFTAGVWSILFISILMTSILAFAICMMLGISTMDRFEDPKSKGLQVPTSSD